MFGTERCFFLSRFGDIANTRAGFLLEIMQGEKKESFGVVVYPGTAKISVFSNDGMIAIE